MRDTIPSDGAETAAGPALLIARMRDQLTQTEHQLHVQTWQLRQLVPDDASVPIVAPPAADGCMLR